MKFTSYCGHKLYWGAACMQSQRVLGCPIWKILSFNKYPKPSVQSESVHWLMKAAWWGWSATVYCSSDRTSASLAVDMQHWHVLQRSNLYLNANMARRTQDARTLYLVFGLMSSLWSLNTIPINGSINPAGSTHCTEFLSLYIYLARLLSKFTSIRTIVYRLLPDVISPLAAHWCPLLFMLEWIRNLLFTFFAC